MEPTSSPPPTPSSNSPAPQPGKRLSSAAQLVLRVLRSWQAVSWKKYELKHCWPQLSTIARDTNRGMRTVQRAIRELTAAGEIFPLPRPGSSSLIFFAADDLAAYRQAVHQPDAATETTAIQAELFEVVEEPADAEMANVTPDNVGRGTPDNVGRGGGRQRWPGGGDNVGRP